MSSCIEHGKCDICGQEAIIWRKTYHYGIKCYCCIGEHFEVVHYCDDCEGKVRPPQKVSIEIKPRQLMTAREALEMEELKARIREQIL